MIMLNQTAYIHNILAQFGMCKENYQESLAPVKPKVLQSTDSICCGPWYIYQIWPVLMQAQLTIFCVPGSPALPLFLFKVCGLDIPHVGTVRGHPFISLLPLSSPTLPLFICTSPIPLHHLQGPHSKADDFRTHNPMTFQKLIHRISLTSHVLLCSYLSSIGRT
jgi:hypothetical protein